MKTTCQACGQPAAMTIIGRTRICESCRPAMMAEIDTLRAEGESVDVARIAYAMRPPEPERRHTPSADAVHAYLQQHDITGSQAARMMYLSGSRQVRKYTGGESPRQMDGARWFALHAHIMLTQEQIAEIESAMDFDANIPDYTEEMPTPEESK